MKRSACLALAAAFSASVLSLSAFAQAGSGAAPPPTAQGVPAAGARPAPATEGEVRKVDREQGRLTLRHARIENLDMAAMTMVFRVADPRLLEGLQPGTRVRFDAESVGGALTVTRIEPFR